MANSIRNQETLMLAHVVVDLSVEAASKKSTTNTLPTNDTFPASTKAAGDSDLAGQAMSVVFDALAKELAQVFGSQIGADKATTAGTGGGGTTGTTGTGGTTTVGTPGATGTPPSTMQVQEPSAPTGGGPYTYPTNASGNVIPASQLEVSPSTGINSSQIFQGAKTGDCVFLGILGSIGQANPQYLSSLIKPATNGQGQAETDAQGYPLYQITLHQPNGQPWTYTTDAKFPAGAALSTPDADGKQDIGVPLLEKAMAAYNNQFDVFAGTGTDQGYDGISGGDSTKIMQALTGTSASLVNVKDMTAQQTTELFANSLDKGVVAGIDRASFSSLSAKSLPSGATVVPQTFQNGDEQWLYTASNGQKAETIPMAHAYSVVGADTSTNTVQLFNPWGVIEGQNKGTATFTLPTADYQALMDTTTIGNVDLRKRQA